jgi:digeranylgeranylglycerophospholipid reductase
MNYTDSVVLESPNEYYVGDQPGAVLEFADFKRWLVRDGREKGATYRFDSRVSKPVVEGGEVVGVRYDGDEEVYGDIVVDATGPAAPLAKELGVSDLQRERQAIGIEWEFEGVDVDHPDYADLTDAMMLRLDHDLAPGGYSWIFHTGGDTAKVGLCYIQNEYHTRYASDGMTIDDYLTRWLESDPRFEGAERIEGKQSHRGSAHIQSPGALSTDNFMAIGDTVPTIDPLWGEGIRKGMKSARAAAVTADACLTGTRDTSAAAMETYNRLWHERVAPTAGSRLLMTELLYFAPNDRYDQLMRDLSASDEDTLSQINNGNKAAFREILHLSDLPLLARFARDRLAN